MVECAKVFVSSWKMLTVGREEIELKVYFTLHGF